MLISSVKDKAFSVFYQEMPGLVTSALDAAMLQEKIDLTKSFVKLTEEGQE